MACRGFFECILKLLNFVVMVVGMAMTGFAVYLLVMWLQVLTPSPAPTPSVAPSGDLVRLGRPMLLLLLDPSLPDGTAERLSSAWFIFAFIGIGVILFITSIFGCAGASTRSGCCLSTYSFLIILFIIVELAAGCFIFFDHSWKDVIPVDKTGSFDMMYSFLKENWKIAKWVALGAVVFEVIHMVSHWVQLWALLSPEGQRDAMAIGCTRLQMVAQDNILCQAGWRHNRRIQ